MAKIFIETYIRLADSSSGQAPLVNTPGLRHKVIDIPTDSSQPSWVFTHNENIIKLTARANCAVYLKGWAKDANASTAIESNLMILTANSAEYMSLPDRVGNWSNVSINIRKDLD